LLTATAVLLVCLQTLGDTVVLSPSSPANMDGAIDSSMDPLGPLFLPHADTLGAGNTNVNVLAQTSDQTLHTSTGVSLAVRANTVVVAVSRGLTDRLDASLVLPIVQEHVNVTVTGAAVGHSTVTFSGPSDLAVRLKYQLLPGLAAILKATFPTGNPSEGLGTGSYFLTSGLAAQTLLGPLQLTARVAYNLDLSFAHKSSLAYGAGLSTLIPPFPWLGAAVEFLGQSGTGPGDPLVLFGVDYSQRHTEIIAFGLRAIVFDRWMIFTAGTYALNRGGLRDDRVFPTLGIGGNF